MDRLDGLNGVVYHTLAHPLPVFRCFSLFLRLLFSSRPICDIEPLQGPIFSPIFTDLFILLQSAPIYVFNHIMLLEWALKSVKNFFALNKQLKIKKFLFRKISNLNWRQNFFAFCRFGLKILSIIGYSDKLNTNLALVLNFCFWQEFKSGFWSAL